MDLKRLIPLAGMPIMLVIVEVVALLLSLPVQEAGIAAFENPESFANPLIFIGILLVFTLLLLILIKYRFQKIMAIIIAVSIFFTFIYIFAAITYTLVPDELLGLILTFGLSIAATAILYRYPEWYVIDTLGILIAAGAASIFGVSLEVLPVIVLLALLAVYDAISVYKTKHMITLAEGVIDLKTPILFVIPKKRSYSYVKEGIAPIGEGSGERGAFIMGMGDLIMPTILGVSANVFIKTGRIGFINAASLGTIAGSVAGLVLLLWFVNKGKPQAGLPPINGGAILGFVIGFLAGGW
jgi:presenilin-like A22 family membrane protease